MKAPLQLAVCALSGWSLYARAIFMFALFPVCFCVGFFFFSLLGDEGAICRSYADLQSYNLNNRAEAVYTCLKTYAGHELQKSSHSDLVLKDLLFLLSSCKELCQADVEVKVDWLSVPPHMERERENILSFCPALSLLWLPHMVENSFR